MKRKITTILLAMLLAIGTAIGLCACADQEDIDNALLPVEQQVMLINTTLDDMKATDKTLNDSITALTTRVTTLETELVEVNTKITSLQADSATKAELETAKNALQAQIDYLNAEIADLKAKDTDLQTQIAALQNSLTSEIADVKTWASQTFLSIVNWNTEKTQIENEITYLHHTVGTIEATIATMHTTITALQEEIDKNTQDIKDLQDLTEHLKNCINGKHEIDTSIYTWADDFSSCTASGHCKYCGDCEIITTNISYSNFKLTATFDSIDNIVPVVLDISDATNFTNVQIKNAVRYMISNGETDCFDVKLVLASDAGKDVFEVIYDALQVAENGSVNLSIDGVNSIPKSAFASNLIIKSLSLGESVKKIDNFAFSMCYNLSFVDLGCVEVIGENSFSGCTKLTGISIPSTVKVISKTAFFVSGLITIPSTVEELGVATFKSSSALTSVTIENGITKIENYAFQECTSLSTIKIPKSVTVIGTNSFKQCKIENIYYGGTKEDWEKISFDPSWNENSNVETYTVHFSDDTTESYSHN